MIPDDPGKQSTPHATEESKPPPPTPQSLPIWPRGKFLLSTTYGAQLDPKHVGKNQPNTFRLIIIIITIEPRSPIHGPVPIVIGTIQTEQKMVPVPNSIQSKQETTAGKRQTDGRVQVNNETILVKFCLFVFL